MANQTQSEQYAFNAFANLPFYSSINSEFIELANIYDKKSINEDGLKEIINNLKNDNVSGINVTVPFKKTVIPFLDVLTPLAKETDSVIELETTRLTADELLQRYCVVVYKKTGSYVETANRLQLDRRTVKSKIDAWDGT